MEEKYLIKCYHNEQIKEATIQLTDNLDNTTISFKMEDLRFEKTANNYFSALLEVRKELEPLEIKLLCKGCCRNVYPSSMSMDMCGGMVAYTMTLGEEVKRKKDSVHIFDDATLEEYSTIEEQLRYYEEWYESIKLVREARQKQE